MSKTRTGKKFLSLLLTLCMVLSLTPALGITASAATVSSGLTNVTVSTITYIQSEITGTTLTPGKTYGMQKKSGTLAFTNNSYKTMDSSFFTVVPGSVMPTNTNSANLTPASGDVCYAIGGDKKSPSHIGYGVSYSPYQHTISGQTATYYDQTAEFFGNFDGCGGILAMNSSGHRYGCINSGSSNVAVRLYEIKTYVLDSISVELVAGKYYKIGGTPDKSNIQTVTGTYKNVDNDGDCITATINPSAYTVGAVSSTGATKSSFTANTDKLRVTVTDSNTGISKSADANVTFSYDIIYITHADSSGGGASMVKTHGIPVYVPASDGTYAGHVFKGWSLGQNSSTVNYAPGAEFNVEASTKLYAVWEAITYHTVIFSDGVTSQSIATGGKVIKPSPDPTKTKAGGVTYTFDGWYTAAGVKWNFDNDVVNGAITLTAGWNESYDVTFDRNLSGAVATSSATPAQPNTQSVVSGKLAAEPEPLATWTGTNNITYVFDGWYTKASGGDKWNFYGNPITKPITLYAHWTQKYNVNFDLNYPQNTTSGTTTMPGTQTVDPNAKVADPSLDAAYQTIVAGGYDYTFTGWYTKAGDKWNFSINPVDSSITLYAHWAQKHTVSFSLNYPNVTGAPTGTTVPSAQQVADGGYVDGARVTAPADWTATNGDKYYFAGWYTDASAGELWYFSGRTVSSDMTLYAQWSTVQSYNVVFDDNVGDPEEDYIYFTGSLTQNTVAATAKATVPTVSRVDYTFGGWYTDEACTSSKVYNTNQTLNANNAADIANENKTITLYAKWTANYSDDDKVLVETAALDNGAYRGYYSDYIEAFKNDSSYPGTKVALYRNFFLVSASGNKANASVLPEGLFLNQRTGEVYGAPTETGEFTFYVRLANDEGQWISKTSDPITLTIENAVFSVDMYDDNTGISKTYGENDPDEPGDFYPATGSLKVTFTKGAPGSIVYKEETYETTFNYDYSRNNSIRTENAKTFNPAKANTLMNAPDLAAPVIAATPAVTVNMDFHRNEGEDAGVYKLYMTEDCVWTEDGDTVLDNYTFTIADALAAAELTYNEADTPELTTETEYVFTINPLASVSYTVSVPYGTYASGGDAAGETWSNTATLVKNTDIGVEDVLNTAIISGENLSTSGKLKPGEYTAAATIHNNADPLTATAEDTTANYTEPSFKLTITAAELTPVAKPMSVTRGSTLTLEKLQGLIDLGAVSGDKVGVTITSVTIGDITYTGDEDLAGADFIAALAGLTTATGSKPVTIGYSNVLTGDDADNYSITPEEGTVDATLIVYVRGGGSGGAVAAPDNVPVIVDGVSYNIGTAKTEGSVTTVTVDQTELKKQLNAASETVVVPITTGQNADTAVAQLVVANVDDMAGREMTLSITVDNVSYDMRAVAIDTEALMAELGATDPTKVPVDVTIKELANSSVTLNSGTLVLPPVEFAVTATYGGKTAEVEVFEKYVQRVIEIPSAVDASKITTAVVVESDSQRHVPTNVYRSGGKWYAEINSLTSSTYALISNEASFTDADGKWFEAVVTEMASRGVINGRSEGVFDGDANITRAEFAAILVRALGLPETGDASAFTDVAKTAWYYGAVGRAYEYGLINGRGNDIFDPAANITRQEAMAMVHRAASITEFAGTTGSLAAFSDADSIGAWALSDAQWNVGSGLIQGNNAGMICGQDNITRGETATIILRLLQKSELVDVRTKA